MARVELRNVTHNKLPQKTAEFKADVFIDGIKAGDVRNNGCGGCDLFHPPALLFALNGIALGEPALIADWGTMPCDAEILIARLLDTWLSERDLRRLLKSKVLWHDGTAIWQTPRISTIPRLEAIAKERAATGVRVLNLMPFPEALALFTGVSNAAQ